MNNPVQRDSKFSFNGSQGTSGIDFKIYLAILFEIKVFLKVKYSVKYLKEDGFAMFAFWTRMFF